MTKRVLGTMFALMLGACAQNGEVEQGSPEEVFGEEIEIGDRLEDDMRADNGGWGDATRCKYTPAIEAMYEALPNPQIVVSIEGLTVRLYDDTVGFDKVFPIGPGAIDTDGGTTNGESLSMYPQLRYATNDFVISRADRIKCATMHSSGVPLFAGLPFIRWSGPYGLHGPIDKYWQANGGELRRGFVSHGCARMQGADVMELFARIRAKDNVKIHVQREPERRADGTRVDVAQRFIGSECSVNADCNFEGGVCRTNEVGGRGFCTKACTSGCPDLAPNATTFCADDGEGEGFCVPAVGGQNADCRQFDHMVPRSATRPDGSRTATACLPGSRGKTGDRCRSGSDCASNTCVSGLCTVSCSGSCADFDGYATTTCVTDDGFGAGNFCARTCTLASNASECPGDTECVEATRVLGGTRNVCSPLASN